MVFSLRSINPHFFKLQFVPIFILSLLILRFPILLIQVRIMRSSLFSNLIDFYSRDIILLHNYFLLFSFVYFFSHPTFCCYCYSVMLGLHNSVPM